MAAGGRFEDAVWRRPFARTLALLIGALFTGVGGYALTITDESMLIVVAIALVVLGLEAVIGGVRGRRPLLGLLGSMF